jgi:octaprenyl-diphosphate synthase
MTATLAAATNGSRLAGIEKVSAPVLPELAEAERIFAAELHSTKPHVRALIEHLGHYRGKRLRPTLLLLTARACGKVAREHHILAAVVEMIHTATLVHDDVLDKADLRRHVPTINAKWGNQSSVLLGDMLFTHAFYLASTTGSTLACRIIGETTNRVCEGELHQIGESGNLDLTEAAYYDIIDGKTAELTACCCKLGAIFSDMKMETVESLTKFGRDLGIAFQIADDVLDLTGTEAETGKSLGTDLEQQKLTLPMIRLLQASPPSLSRQARQLLLHPTPASRAQLADLLEDSDALAYAIEQAERHAASARAALGLLPASESKSILEKMTHQAIHRNR